MDLSINSQPLGSSFHLQILGIYIGYFSLSLNEISLDIVCLEEVAKEISNLKVETSKTLAQISDRLEEEVNKFKAIQNAITLKEKELQELYEIERSALTLAALIESQEALSREMEATMATEMTRAITVNIALFTGFTPCRLGILLLIKF
jgi:hypothetical protein